MSQPTVARVPGNCRVANFISCVFVIENDLMPYLPARTYREIATRLVPIQAHIRMIYDKQGYPQLEAPMQLMDVRPATLSILLSETALNVMILNILASLNEGTISDITFRSIVGIHDPSITSGYIAQKMSNYLRLALVTMIQFRLENMLVNILAVLDRTKITRPYHNNVKSLLDLLGIAERERHLEKLSILQNIRNCLHNNGIHNNKEMSIIIDDVPFVFEKGKQVNCAGWEHIIIAYEATLIVLDKILSAPQVKAMPEPVSANVPIIASITLTSPSNNNLAESYTLIFLDSSCSPPLTDILIYCQIVVNRTNPTSMEYHGIGKLLYTRGGDFNVKLRALDTPPYGDIDETSATSDFINISPREAATDFLNTKIYFTIGIVSAAAAIATIDRVRIRP